MIGKITGPPGTGKTTELKRLIDRACDKYFPNRIGVISFTNAAIEEIRTRIADTTQESRSVIKNVRTLHSHCYKLLGRPVIAETKINEFNKKHPEFAIKGKLDDEHPIKSIRQNEQIFIEMQINRNRLIPVDQWNPDTRALYTAWTAWQTENEYIDFTGLLKQVYERKLSPDIDILFIDEAQDLTALQYAITRQWSEKAISTIYTGDSDQAIFRFAGGTPEVFIDLKHGWLNHLDRSYRNSPAIHKYGEYVIQQALNREKTAYKPTDRYGQGKIMQVFEPDLSLPGSHMIICRCNYQVKRWLKWLIKQNRLWKNDYRPSDLSWNPCRTQSWKAVNIFYRLMSGRIISVPELKLMVKKLNAKDNLKHGAKTDINRLPVTEQDPFEDRPIAKTIDLFDLAGLGFTDGFINHKQSIDKMFKLTGLVADLIPRMPQDLVAWNKQIDITVGTIHSIKGGEATNVWLDVGTSSLIINEMYRDKTIMYDEARVAYVAVTRAKQTLGLLMNKMWNPLLPRI